MKFDKYIFYIKKKVSFQLHISIKLNLFLVTYFTKNMRIFLFVLVIICRYPMKLSLLHTKIFVKLKLVHSIENYLFPICSGIKYTVFITLFNKNNYNNKHRKLYFLFMIFKIYICLFIFNALKDKLEIFYSVFSLSISLYNLKYFLKRNILLFSKINCV